MLHTTPKKAWWNNFVTHGAFWYGIEYMSGDKTTWSDAKSAEEAQAGAQRLAQKYHVELVELSPAAPRVAVQCPVVEPPVIGPIVFVDHMIAIPTMGGILSDLPLSGDSQRRFPQEVCLPVTQRAAGQDKFVVVEYEGRGVAMAPDEARVLGLVEAPNWIPRLNGVASVPRPGEIESFLAR